MTSDRTQRRRIITVACALVLSALVCAPQAPAADKSGDADLRELSQYTLTMADVRKWAAAGAALKQQEKKAKGEDEDSDDSDDSTDGEAGDESLDEMAKRFERMPDARKAIEGAGLTSRQFAVITMAFMQAAFAQAAVEAGADPAKIARDAHVNPANLKFVKEHKAELEQMKGLMGGE